MCSKTHYRMWVFMEDNCIITENWKDPNEDLSIQFFFVLYCIENANYLYTQKWEVIDILYLYHMI